MTGPFLQPAGLRHTVLDCRHCTAFLMRAGAGRASRALVKEAGAPQAPPLSLRKLCKPQEPPRHAAAVRSRTQDGAARTAQGWRSRSQGPFTDVLICSFNTYLLSTCCVAAAGKLAVNKTDPACVPEKLPVCRRGPST